MELVGCAAVEVVAATAAATVLAEGKRDFLATGLGLGGSTVAAVTVDLIALEERMVLDMDRPSDYSL